MTGLFNQLQRANDFQLIYQPSVCYEPIPAKFNSIELLQREQLHRQFTEAGGLNSDSYNRIINNRIINPEQFSSLYHTQSKNLTAFSFRPFLTPLLQFNSCSIIIILISNSCSGLTLER